MKELMQGPDVEASEEIKVEDIGGLGKSKGTMDFPRSAANVGKKIYRQSIAKGVPKRWKGGGDYFFEQQDDGSLKITGGSSAKSLTGGKSVTITDSNKIKEIYEKARGGDILEENVSYKMSEEAGPSFESRGGGSAGLEYLNETESDAVMSSLDPNLSELDNPIKFAKARRADKEILSEVDQVDREAFKAAMSTNPQMKFLKEKVDELASMGNAEGARMLADLLVNEFKKDQVKFEKDEQTRETISNLRSE